MTYLPSHKRYKKCFSTGHLTDELRDTLNKYKYQLCIYLDLSGQYPIYSFIEIKILSTNEYYEKNLTIINNHLSFEQRTEISDKLDKEEKAYTEDIKHFGELLFLLASKYKYDCLLTPQSPDSSGFLHTEDLGKLNPYGNRSGDKRTDMGKSVWRTLYKLQNEDFLETLFETQKQLFHLVCYVGGIQQNNENYLWWLNMPLANIEFRYADNKEKINPKELEKQLRSFFEGYIFEDNKLSRYIKGTESFIKPKKNNLKQAPLNLKYMNNLKEFRAKLKKDAKQHLCEKLHLDENPGKTLNDYRPLELEVGLIEESNRENEQKDDKYGHNRKWKYFNLKQLDNLQGSYILSSETGTGKTAFLRHLQESIISNTDLIPIFLEASSAATLDYRNLNTNNFIEDVAKLFNGYLQDGNEYNFLKQYQDKVVFLIDGLDQINGKETTHQNLIKNIVGVAKGRLIITSRPFAVIGKEKDSNIKFLRLKGFTKKAQENYFASKYKRATKLCQSCPEMLSIPMLAHMVRSLIEKGWDGKIKNRTGLYKEFIDYIFDEYEHNHHIDISHEMKSNIRKAYGEISFKAILNKEPYFQRIPLSYAIKTKESNIEIDMLLRYGIANLIVNRSQGTQEYVYFSHQSFQEYLAAEYIKGNNDLIEHIISKKWNPKWKEVIKFLVGLKGQGIIEKILDKKDNSIHSKLFLATELIPETQVDNKLKECLYLKLEKCESSIDIEKVFLNVDKKKAINRILRNLDYKEGLNSSCKADDIYISEKSCHPNSLHREHVLYCRLGYLKGCANSIGKNKKILDKLIDLIGILDTVNIKFTMEYFDTEKNVEKAIVRKLETFLDSPIEEDVLFALYELRMQNLHQPRIIKKIKNNLNSPNETISKLATDALMINSIEITD